MGHPFHYLQQAATRIPGGDVAIRTVPGRGGTTDAFGRQRVSQTTSIWENKNIHDRRANHWTEEVAGAGAIAYLPNESSVSLSVGTADGDEATRQTIRYFAYVPGRSQLITMTGVMAPGKTNLEQVIGYGDANDGLFFTKKGTDMYVMVRSSASGSVVETLIHQNDPTKSTDGESVWNLDMLDGTKGKLNASQKTLDPDKAQIFTIDFEWLGVGQVRFGFDFGGLTGLVYCHQVVNANTTDTVYMSTPTLPLCYQIINNGVTESASTMKEICTSVDSEGGYLLPGFSFSASNGVATRSITARTPLVAVRVPATFNGKTNRKTGRFLGATFYTGGNNDAYFEVAHLHPDITATGGTWTAAGNAGSAMEYNLGLTALSSSTAEHVTEPVFLPTGQGASANASEAEPFFINEHDLIVLNKAADDSQVFAIFATPFAGTAVVSAALKWIEFD